MSQKRQKRGPFMERMNGDTFYCVCRHCGARRTVSSHGKRAIYRDDPKAPDDLFAENDCNCPKPPSVLVMVACEHCGETGRHWLGCAYIGLPEIPPDHPSKLPEIKGRLVH